MDSQSSHSNTNTENMLLHLKGMRKDLKAYQRLLRSALKDAKAYLDVLVQIVNLERKVSP